MTRTKWPTTIAAIRCSGTCDPIRESKQRKSDLCVHSITSMKTAAMGRMTAVFRRTGRRRNVTKGKKDMTHVRMMYGGSGQSL